MTPGIKSPTLLAMVVLGVIFLIITTNDAFAHMSFDVKPGNNVNQTIRITLGETKEPAFTDEEHNLEMTIIHKFTSIPVGNAHRSQANPSAQSMFVDAFFYPTNVLVTSAGALSITGGVPAMTGCDGGAAFTNANPADCVPGVGYTDSRTGMSLSSISTNDGGSAGQYRQATRQFYTEQGRTLYHIYGNLNYFNDTGIGVIPINIWTDGANIKKASWCEGLAANIANCRAGTSHNVTLVQPSGGFGLANKTSVYWPDTATENTHPTNLRKAIGTTRDNMWDIWNFLEQISNGLNAMADFVPKVPDHTPRNYTNPGSTNNGQYTFP